MFSRAKIAAKGMDERAQTRPQGSLMSNPITRPARNGQTYHHAVDEVSSAIDRLTFGAGLSEPYDASSRAAFHKVLVGIDASEPANEALGWALEMAKAFDAPLVLTHVVPPPYSQHYDGGYGWFFPLENEHRSLREAGQKLLETAAQRAQREGLDVETILESGSAPRMIARTADAHRADLVVVGSHSRGPVGRAFLGSVSDGVRNRVHASVLIARTAPPPRSIVVGVDGSGVSKRAADLALGLADRWDVKTAIVHAVEPLEPDFLVSESDLARMASPEPEGNVEYLRRSGPAARILAQVARERGAGLVVVGSRGLGAVGNVVMGSASSGVSHQASASVLVVREPR